MKPTHNPPPSPVLYVAAVALPVICVVGLFTDQLLQGGAFGLLGLSVNIVLLQNHGYYRTAPANRLFYASFGLGVLLLIYLTSTGF